MRPVAAALVALTLLAGAQVADARRSGCGTALAYGQHGQVTILVPPDPSVWVRAVSDHRFTFKWSFTTMPAECAPATMLLTIRPAGTRYMPYTLRFPVSGSTGTKTITLPGFMTRGELALSSAETADGRRSNVLRSPVGGGEWRRLAR